MVPVITRVFSFAQRRAPAHRGERLLDRLVGRLRLGGSRPENDPAAAAHLIAAFIAVPLPKRHCSTRARGF